jgi:hypothetical protein
MGMDKQWVLLPEKRELAVKLTIHRGELRRWIVPVRCTSNSKIVSLEPGVYVFAVSEQEARLAAIDKMEDKYRRHQNKHTRWEVTGDPVEA